MNTKSEPPPRTTPYEFDTNSYDPQGSPSQTPPISLHSQFLESEIPIHTSEIFYKKPEIKS